MNRIIIISICTFFVISLVVSGCSDSSSYSNMCSSRDVLEKVNELTYNALHAEAIQNQDSILFQSLSSKPEMSNTNITTLRNDLDKFNTLFCANVVKFNTNSTVTPIVDLQLKYNIQISDDRKTYVVTVTNLQPLQN